MNRIPFIYGHFTPITFGILLLCLSARGQITNARLDFVNAKSRTAQILILDDFEMCNRVLEIRNNDSLEYSTKDLFGYEYDSIGYERLKYEIRAKDFRIAFLKCILCDSLGIYELAFHKKPSAEGPAQIFKRVYVKMPRDSISRKIRSGTFLGFRKYLGYFENNYRLVGKFKKGLYNSSDLPEAFVEHNAWLRNRSDQVQIEGYYPDQYLLGKNIEVSAFGGTNILKPISQVFKYTNGVSISYSLPISKEDNWYFRPIYSYEFSKNNNSFTRPEIFTEHLRSHELGVAFDKILFKNKYLTTAGVFTIQPLLSFTQYLSTKVRSQETEFVNKEIAEIFNAGSRFEIGVASKYLNLRIGSKLSLGYLNWKDYERQILRSQGYYLENQLVFSAAIYSKLSIYIGVNKK